MSGISHAFEQSNNVVAPRLGQIIAQAVDATSRGYDLTIIAFNAVKAANLGLEDEFFIDVMAEGNDVFWATDSAAPGVNAIDDTAATAAGTPPTLDDPTTVHTGLKCGHLIAGQPSISVRLDRAVDKTLVLKCAAGKTATFRYWPSSQSTPGVTG